MFILAHSRQSTGPYCLSSAIWSRVIETHAIYLLGISVFCAIYGALSGESGEAEAKLSALFANLKTEIHRYI